MPDLSAFGRYANVSFLVLTSLATGPKHGYAMIEDIQQFSGTHLEPGPLYGALTRLERQGWIAALPPEERRRPYRITTAGIRVLQEQVASLERVAGAGRARLALLGG